MRPVTSHPTQHPGVLRHVFRADRNAFPMPLIRHIGLRSQSPPPSAYPDEVVAQGCPRVCLLGEVRSPLTSPHLRVRTLHGKCFAHWLYRATRDRDPQPTIAACGAYSGSQSCAITHSSPAITTGDAPMVNGTHDSQQRAPREGSHGWSGASPPLRI